MSIFDERAQHETPGDKEIFEGQGMFNSPDGKGSLGAGSLRAGISPHSNTKMLNQGKYQESTRSNMSIKPKKIGYLGTEEEEIGKSQIVKAGPEHKDAVVGVPLDKDGKELEFKLDAREYGT